MHTTTLWVGQEEKELGGGTGMAALRPCLCVVVVTFSTVAAAAAAVHIQFEFIVLFRLN